MTNILNNDTSHGMAEQWTKWFGDLAGKPGLRFLEIGSWEGQSAMWFLRNILTSEDSSMACVDTWKGGGDMPGVEDDSIFKKFLENIRPWGAPKVTVMRNRSDAVLPGLWRETYDLVYIDGSHVASDVLSDSVLSWRILKPGGLLIWDDYQLDHGNTLLEPGEAIDAFLRCYRGKYKLIAKEYQVCIRKNP